MVYIMFQMAGKNLKKEIRVAQFAGYVSEHGGYHHGAEWDLKPGEERLTLITFFYELKAPWYPVPEMRRRNVT